MNECTKHCWHDTGKIVEFPPKLVEVCCTCGKEKQTPIFNIENYDDPKKHGKYHPRNRYEDDGK